MAPEGCFPVEFQLEDVQLDIEKFLEFQPVLGLPQIVGRFREMDVVQGLVEVHQIVPFDKPRRKGFRYFPVDGLEDVRLDFGNQLGGQVTLFHFLRRGIDGLNSHELPVGGLVVGVDFGVDDVQLLVEHGGPPCRRRPWRSSAFVFPSRRWRGWLFWLSPGCREVGRQARLPCIGGSGRCICRGHNTACPRSSQCPVPPPAATPAFPRHPVRI